MTDTPPLIVPRKAMEAERGRVISFTSRYSQTIERSGLLPLIAREMTQTDLAVEEAGWSSPPAVLVMTSFTYALNNVAIFHQRYGFPHQSMSHAEIELEERVLGLAGNGGNLDFFTEFEFLSRIRRDSKSGVLIYEHPHNATTIQKEVSLRWAEKYFDYILVDHSSLPAKKGVIADYSVTVPEDVSIEKTTRRGLKRGHHQIDVGRSGYEILSSESILRIPSYTDNRYHNKGPGSVLFSDTKLMRFFVSDIARHILDVPLRAKKDVDSIHVPLLTTARNPNHFKRIAAHAGVLTALPVVVGLPSAAALAAEGAVITMLAAGGACVATMFTALALSAVSKKRLESGSTYSSLNEIANVYPLMDKGMDDTIAEVSVPDKQEAVSFSGRILSVSVDSQTRTNLNKEDIAISSFLAPQRTPLEIAHTKAGEIIQRWSEYELDPIRFLEFPLMSDPSDPDIAEFYRLFSEMSMYRDMVAKNPEHARAFVSSVTQAEKAFIVAEGKAKKMRDSYLDTRGQKKLRKAHPFVSIMADEGASLNERRLAYQQASKILAGVMALPDKTVKGLLESAPTKPSREEESW